MGIAIVTLIFKIASCNLGSPLQESPGPGIPKESPKSLPGPSGPGSKKCPKQSKNSLRSLETVYFETPETVSRLFRTLLGPRSRKAPGDSLETPVRGGRDPKNKHKISRKCLDLRIRSYSTRSDL